MRLRAAALVAALGALASCVSNPGPRFSPEIAASFAHQPMRRLETQQLELYYPASAHDEALRVASRLTRCLEQLRTYPRSGIPRPKLLLYLTSANFNNAYVQPQYFGSPQQMVVPLHETEELFNLTIDPGAEVADISCHEAVHYVQMQEVRGLWALINRLGGDVLSPNIYTESWFLEGLAVHYEGRLGKEVGRPWNPIWHGMFASGVAENHGVLDPGYLQGDHRDATPFGGSYLVGEQFVDYLARRFGEDKLWELVDVQAGSVIPQLGLALRFKVVYGESLGALFADFSRELQQSARERPRPANQKLLRDELGSSARLAAAPDGTLAVVFAPRDRPVQLAIYRPDDTLLYQDEFRRILPERAFISASPFALSGLSFSQDGKKLYFVVTDVALDGDDENRLVELDVATNTALRTWGHLEGLGGALSPDGTRYVFTHLHQDLANLVSLDLASGTWTALTHYTGHESLGTAAISPSGKRIAFPKWMGLGFDLYLLEDGQERAVTHDQRFNQSPRWLDEDHVVLLRSEGDRSQAFVVDVNTGALTAATDAPFTAFDPAPRPGGRLAFVNRDGWHWTLDEVPLPPMPTGAPPQAVPPAELESSLAPVTVLQDEPYRALDHLLIPTLRIPSVVFDLLHPESGSVAMNVAGSDRLGMHNYALNAQLTLPGRATVLSASYVNDQLAPWEVGVGAGRAEDPQGQIVDYGLDVGVGRTFWTTPLSLDVPLLWRQTPQYLDRVVGPRLSTTIAATDGSVYGGTQRGFAIGLSAAAFPEALGNDFDFADLRGSARIYLPQPIPRGSLSFLGLAHALPGAPKTLLRVGGLQPADITLQSTTTTGDGLAGVLLPSGLAFSEGLRGYEDHVMHGNLLMVAGLDYHWPLVIDYGWASTLYLLPSFFVRQVDLSAFARDARIEGATFTNHRVLGGSVSIQTRVGSLSAPTLFYQYAQRFDDGLGPLHLVGLSF